MRGASCAFVAMAFLPGSGLRAAGSAASATPPGMIWIRGGEFEMGSEEQMFADARPRHRVRVRSFWIDATEVTNAQFARFVNATGYRTVAEQPLDPRQFPDVPADQLVAGSIVFSDPGRPVSLDDPTRWWRQFAPGT